MVALLLLALLAVGSAPIHAAALAWEQPASPTSCAGRLWHSELCSVEEAVEEAIFDNCFLAGTPIVAGVENSDGSVTRVAKPVEEVKADDWVKAKDPRTGEVGWKRVKRTFENMTTEVWSVTVGPAECLPLMRQTGRTERHDIGQAGSGGRKEGGEDGEPPPGSHVVRCTAGHPWALREPAGRIRWEFASALRVGDLLDPEDGRAELVVLAIEVRQEVARTFNFEVEGFHTYYVAGPQGQQGVLVHNMSRAAIRAARAARRAAQNSLIADTGGRLTRRNAALAMRSPVKGGQASVAGMGGAGADIRFAGAHGGQVFRREVKALASGEMTAFSGGLREGLRQVRLGGFAGPAEIMFQVPAGVSRAGAQRALVAALRLRPADRLAEISAINVRVVNERGTRLVYGSIGSLLE